MNKLSKALIAAAQLIDDLAIEPGMIDKIKIDADKPEIVIRLDGHESTVESLETHAKQVYLPALYGDKIESRPMANFKNRMTITEGPVVIKCDTDAY